MTYYHICSYIGKYFSFSMSFKRKIFSHSLTNKTRFFRWHSVLRVGFSGLTTLLPKYLMSPCAFLKEKKNISGSTAKCERSLTGRQRGSGGIHGIGNQRVWSGWSLGGGGAGDVDGREASPTATYALTMHLYSYTIQCVLD